MTLSDLTRSGLVHPAVGHPSISEAPTVRIAQSPATGSFSVWVQGIGYLDRDERKVLGQALVEDGND